MRHACIHWDRDKYVPLDLDAMPYERALCKGGGTEFDYCGVRKMFVGVSCGPYFHFGGDQGSRADLAAMKQFCKVRREDLLNIIEELKRPVLEEKSQQNKSRRLENYCESLFSEFEDIAEVEHVHSPLVCKRY